MSPTVEVEVPAETGALLERYPFLKRAFGRIAVEELRRRVLKLLVADKLLEESKVTEEDILKLDKAVKRRIRERVEDALHGQYE
ncbi:MAG: hypothetical protein DRN96_06010 [Thermoproteota archaeon]|nr:MAG: hypothetical protein DRN96_06010 [Candidatus Korarchaeota archaeon]